MVLRAGLEGPQGPLNAGVPHSICHLPAPLCLLQRHPSDLTTDLITPLSKSLWFSTGTGWRPYFLADPESWPLPCSAAPSPCCHHTHHSASCAVRHGAIFHSRTCRDLSDLHAIGNTLPGQSFPFSLLESPHLPPP